MPGEPEALALAALVRLAEGRRPARLDDTGAMVPPEAQDMSLWRHDLIDEGARLLDRAANYRRSGPYQLMAAIHAVHAARRETVVTDWAGIVALYDALLVVRPSPIAAVNRAVALGEARDAETGLASLDAIEGGPWLDRWLPYQAARAGLLAKAGREAETAEALRAALALAPAPAERLFLERRLARGACRRFRLRAHRARLGRHGAGRAAFHELARRIAARAAGAGGAFDELAGRVAALVGGVGGAGEAGGEGERGEETQRLTHGGPPGPAWGATSARALRPSPGEAEAWRNGSRRPPPRGSGASSLPIPRDSQ
jgi:hypothetical protein